MRGKLQIGEATFRVAQHGSLVSQMRWRGLVRLREAWDSWSFFMGFKVRSSALSCLDSITRARNMAECFRNSALRSAAEANTAKARLADSFSDHISDHMYEGS